MATIQITVDQSVDDGGEAVAGVLREIADKIEKGQRRFRVNGEGRPSAKVRAMDVPGGNRKR